MVSCCCCSVFLAESELKNDRRTVETSSIYYNEIYFAKLIVMTFIAKYV